MKPASSETPARETAVPDRPLPGPGAPPPAPLACPRYRSETLFAGGNEVHIDHDSQLYRLRRTALGKLILTK